MVTSLPLLVMVGSVTSVPITVTVLDAVLVIPLFVTEQVSVIVTSLVGKLLTVI